MTYTLERIVYIRDHIDYSL